MTPPTIDQSVIERVASAQTLKPMICEMLSHRGERPNRVLRGGQELWETWVPSVQAGLRYFLSPSPIAGKEGVRDLATHVASAVMTWGGPHFKHIVSFNVLCEAIEASLASFATPPAECVAPSWTGQRPTREEIVADAIAGLREDIAECVATPGKVTEVSPEAARSSVQKLNAWVSQALDPDPATPNDVRLVIADLEADADRWMMGDMDRDNEEAGLLSHAAATLLTQMEARIAAAERDETCPLCEGREMGPGEFCIATCRDGKVRWTTANVLRSMAPHLAGDRRRIEAQAARIAALEKALEPMVRCCQDIEQGYTFDLPDHQTQFPQITMGELRTARALLNPTPTEER